MNILRESHEAGNDSMKQTINKARMTSRGKQVKGDIELGDFQALLRTVTHEYSQ